MENQTTEEIKNRLSEIIEKITIEERLEMMNKYIPAMNMVLKEMNEIGVVLKKGVETI